MKEISLVVLDADGVVNEGKFFSLADFGTSHEVLQPFFQKEFADCLIGKADLRERLVPYLNDWNWKGTVDELLQFWFEQGSGVHGAVVGVVKRLKEKGIPVHLATNQERRRAAYMKDIMEYGDLFEQMHVSSHMGVVKPSPEFFEKVFAASGVEHPSQILFWDDMQKNVEAAKQVGFQSHHFLNEHDFQQVMWKYFDL